MRATTAPRNYNITWVERHFDVRGVTGDEYDVLCPVHNDRSASMRINVAKGVCYCHACGTAAPLAKLARLMRVAYSTGNKDEADMTELLRKLDTLRSQSNRPSKPAVFMPESDLERFKFPTRYWTDPLPHGRGFTTNTVEAFDLGYDPMQECAIIPIRDGRGRLMGITRRFLSPDADKRYKDPKGFDKANHLFGLHFAEQDERPYVVLTEGPLDAIKVWQAGHPALAQFGSNLSAQQVKLLRRLGVITVILFYDNDAAGRKVTKSALGWKTKVGTKGERFQRYDHESDLRRSFVVKQVSYRGVAGKDPGSLADEALDQLVMSAAIIHPGRRT